MKFQKIISKLLAAGIAAVGFVGASGTANAETLAPVYVGGSINIASTGTWTNGDLSASYDHNTQTLTFTGKGTVKSGQWSVEPNGRGAGAGIFAYTGGTLTINLAEGADVTVVNYGTPPAGYGADSETYAIYMEDTKLNITGAGKLTVKSTGANYCTGIYTYTTKKVSEDVGVTIDGAAVDVDANGTSVARGIYTTGGNLDITNNASVTVKGYPTRAVALAGNGITGTLTYYDQADALASNNYDGSGASEINTANLQSYKYVSITPKEAETGVYVASRQITSKGWTNGGLSASYDAKTKTLTFTGTGSVDAGQISVNGVVTYGAGIFTNNEGTLTINLADGADVTVNGKSHESYPNSYGIYAPNADIKIAGSGKLTVNAPAMLSQSETAQSNAIETAKNVIIEGAAVNAAGLAAASGWGSRGISAAGVSLTNNAILNARGVTRAVQIKDSALSIYENAAVKAAKHYDGTELNPFVNEYTDIALKAYQLVSIKPQTYMSTTENKGGFVSDDEKKTGDENDELTVFETSINGSGTIDTIYWNIRHSSTEKALFPSAQPEITLNGGSAIVTVIVKGLADSEASATAVIF